MIPKAEEFYDKRIKGIPMSFNEKMIEFARLHVEAALKEASEKAISREDIAIFAEGTFKVNVVDRLSILNSYPLTNIV